MCVVGVCITEVVSNGGAIDPFVPLQKVEAWRRMIEGALKGFISHALMFQINSIDRSWSARALAWP